MDDRLWMTVYAISRTKKGSLRGEVGEKYAALDLRYASSLYPPD